MHSSILKMWEDFKKENPHFKGFSLPLVDQFCNNEKDSNECAQLVFDGKKTGTCGLLLDYELCNEQPPKLNDLCIVTNWDKEAVCIIKTLKVEKIAFKDVDETWAETEGEGDLSLAYWRRVHITFFNNVLKEHNMVLNKNMILVCETFERVF